MYALFILTGLVVAGVLIGVLRNRTGSDQQVPNPFRRRR